MMRIHRQALRVLEALRDKPVIFYEMMRIISEDEILVASPWEGPEDTRVSAQGECVAQVMQEQGGDTPRWTWWVLDNVGVEGTYEEARLAADAQLEALGWILA